MHTLPALRYAYHDLEPHIDARTMEIHYTKHHQAYVDKLNAALEAVPALQNTPLDELLTRLKEVPEAQRTALQNNGGGHWNHSLFWSILSPQGGGEPTGELANLMNQRFGSFAQFQTDFSQAALNRFGSGWAWLIIDNGVPNIVSTPNQDTPAMDGKHVLLGLDVWEHAYYLHYQNRRADYIAAWWNVVDWNAVAARL